MDQQTQPEAHSDPVIDGIVDLMMTHYKNENGAIDWPLAAAAFAQVIAEMIGPQQLPVRKHMVLEFSRELDKAVQLAALRASVITGGKE